MTDTTEPVFRSDMTVQLVKASASDADLVFAARVSTQGERSLDAVDADPERSAGLIRYLIRSRHGSPAEHSTFTFYVHAPIFVFREFQRHRHASYSEESGRYRELAPVFYTPDADRALQQVGKAGEYTFEPGTEEQQDRVNFEMGGAATHAYAGYRSMLDAGVAREVARMVLPLNIFSSMYVTMNARGLMNFLSLRTTHEDAAVPSTPQREIEMVAEQMEAIFAQHMPLTHSAWNDNGRIAP